MLIISEPASVPVLSEMLLPRDTRVGLLTASLFLGELLNGFILYRTISTSMGLKAFRDFLEGKVGGQYRVLGIQDPIRLS